MSTETLQAYLEQGRDRLRIAAYRRWLAIHPDPEPLDTTAALDDLAPEPHVLFLCFGNICRSPFAERYLRERLDDRGLEQVSMSSSGFFDREGRTSPEVAVETAQRFDVDLTSHRSDRVTDAQLHDADLVLLMDARNYTQFRDAGATDGAVFLGAFTDGDAEISDPYDSSHAEFERVYGQITDAIDVLADRLETVLDDQRRRDRADVDSDADADIAHSDADSDTDVADSNTDVPGRRTG